MRVCCTYQAAFEACISLQGAHKAMTSQIHLHQELQMLLDRLASYLGNLSFLLGLLHMCPCYC